jgi:hypothetical protein
MNKKKPPQPFFQPVMSNILTEKWSKKSTKNKVCIFSSFHIAEFLQKTLKTNIFFKKFQEWLKDKFQALTSGPIAKKTKRLEIVIAWDAFRKSVGAFNRQLANLVFASRGR